MQRRVCSTTEVQRRARSTTGVITPCALYNWSNNTVCTLQLRYNAVCALQLRCKHCVCSATGVTTPYALYNWSSNIVPRSATGVTIQCALYNICNTVCTLQLRCNAVRTLQLRYNAVLKIIDQSTNLRHRSTPPFIIFRIAENDNL